MASNTPSSYFSLGKLERELRDAWVRELYTEEGAAIWIADAEKKGHTLSEQLTRLEQLRTGAFA